ncbi:MAG: beta-propeller domain-containing protein [Candidatus Thiodiazotropha sp.]
MDAPMELEGLTMTSQKFTYLLLLLTGISLASFNSRAIHTNQATLSTAGTTASATMTWTVDNSDLSGYSALFDTDDSVSVSLSIQVDDDSVGAERNLYLAALLEDVWYMRDDQGIWRIWSGLVDDLVPFRHKTLAATEILDVHDGAPLPPGEYAVYGGYEANNGNIVYNQHPLTFIVFDTANPSLHRFRHQATLENYLLEAMIEAYGADRDNPVVGSTDVGVSVGIPAPVSQTNLQEQGVDEADLIKTDGQHLYTLGSCSSSTTNNCIAIHSIAESPPSNQLLNEVDIPGETTANGIYLLKERGEGLDDLIVTAGGIATNDYISIGVMGPMPIWEEPRFWSNGKSEVNLFRLDSATTPTHDRTLSFDGAMISSRVIDDTLYLVTRYTPTLEDLDQYAYTTAELDANRTLLENASLAQLIPSATSNETPLPLISANKCYLAPSATAVDPDPTIITVIAISLTAPDSFRTTCFLGSSEVLYASQEAIYLAADSAMQVLLPGDVSSRQTEIHKLALSDSSSTQAAEYRGSVQVRGHLGFSADYKSFRMGEHQGVLRIATSIGSTGSDSSSTSVSLLREATNGGRLEEAGRLDGLGRPGEFLYASRFLGDRGYLVTFKKVDPLYVLDLSDPENPVSLGELEISGYSEYLHPVGENYLLGIGKEAIDDENSTDRDGLGFAWYQGLKISLFDVSDPTTPTEVNSIVLGGRGTTSNILDEHHAFAYLPQTDLLPMRFSIPVDLYNEPPNANPEPNQSWSWTHTGLYTFDIKLDDSPGVELVDQFVVNQNSQTSYSAGVWNDRSVILGDSVHYLHNESLYSSSIPARE